MRRTPALLLVLWMLPLAGCALRAEMDLLTPHEHEHKPAPCKDGDPVKVLQDPECPDGICGYSCAPDRWKDDA